jgi:hypothetical protein
MRCWLLHVDVESIRRLFDAEWGVYRLAVFMIWMLHYRGNVCAHTRPRLCHLIHRALAQSPTNLNRSDTVTGRMLENEALGARCSVEE